MYLKRLYLSLETKLVDPPGLNLRYEVTLLRLEVLRPIHKRQCHFMFSLH